MFNRITELQSHVSLVEQFDQALITFSQWSENTLSNLHSASQVNVNNLQASMAQVKVRIRPLVHFDELANGQQNMILCTLPMTGGPGGLAEAVWLETEPGAAN